LPGIVVQTVDRQAGQALATPPSGRYFVVGLFQRGSTDATVVSSLSQFVALYGDRPTYSFAYDDLTTYFREGGGEAVVARVVGPAASTGTRTFNAAGTTTPTVRFDASSPGAWSSDVQVEITAGATNTVTVGVYYRGEVVNRYSNLGSVSAIVNAVSQSSFVQALDLGGELPAAVAKTALSAGSDDRLNVSTTTMTAGLAKFSPDLGVGAVAIPGYTVDQVGGALQTHAGDNRRIALLHLAQDLTVQDAAAAGEGFVSAQGKAVGIFHPWVQIPGPGNTPLTVPPTGYVAAKRAVAHRTVGAWRVPAGQIATADYLVGVDQQYSTADANTLDEANISVIRSFAGVIELYGYRSLSTDEATYPLLNKQDATNVVAQDMEALLQPRVFGSVDADGIFFETIKGDAIGYLDPIRQLGGLYALKNTQGDELDPGYQVVVDATLNTAASLARNEVYVKVGLRWSPVAELIYLTITSVPLTTAF
jgi:hypothetical protein